jgi:glycosyltransferase involved in cell wall biosynthesis
VQSSLPGVHGRTSKSVLLLDISRLIWRARRRAPTGIDRVELAYAQHFIERQGDRPVHGVLHLFGFVYAVSAAGGRRFVRDLAARWEGGATASRAARWSLIKMYLRLFTSGWYIGPWLRRRLRARPGTGTFLVVSHHHVARGHTLDRLRGGLGVKTVCLIHDLIPLDYPEYFKPGWERRYRKLSSNVGRLFDAVIANSESTARSLRACLPRQPDEPSSRVAIRVMPLGVRALPVKQNAPATPDLRPYFVVLGTIEPRKNHLLLLNLWTRLAARMAEPPRLIVIGARGWENEQVVDMLERSRRLHGLVEERNGLSDAQVSALLHQARALLLPSFAEGFGLPLAEALSAQVPVICSDIPVFRELGGKVPEYLDPLDVHAWSNAVVEYARPDSERRTAQLQRLENWRSPCWIDHFAAVEQLLSQLDATGDSEHPVPTTSDGSASEILDSP